MLLTIRIISAEETIDLRHKVLWPDHLRESVLIPEDSVALHFGGFNEERLIAVASFFPDEKNYRLRKFAVDPEYQSKGIGSLLVERAIEHLQVQGGEELWGTIRVSATAFYRRNGFSIETDVFQKKGIDYVIARRSLKKLAMQN